jgi:hypothetical protein
VNPIWVDVLIFGVGLIAGAVGMVLYLAFGVKEVDAEPSKTRLYPLQTSKTFWFGFRRSGGDHTLIEMRIEGDPPEVYDKLKIAMSKTEALDAVTKIISMLE